MKNQLGIKGAQRLLRIQLALSMIGAGVALALVGVHAGLSALLGGLVSALPNAYFARRLFKNQSAKAARQIVNNFYLGEAIKIALAMILFVLVFTLCKIIPWIFFAAYIGVQMSLWFAPIIFKHTSTGPERD